MPEGFFGWVSLILQKYWPLFLSGTVNTVVISISGTVIGFGIGMLVAIMRIIPVHPGDNVVKRTLVRVLQWVLAAYIEIFRCTPMMVQGMVIYYGALQYFSLDMPRMVAGIFVISINTGAYMAEIMRGGIFSVDKGQTEGALSIGMTHWQAMFSVVIPQAVRNVLPSIGNEFVVNIKDSSVLNVITVAELYFAGKSAAGTYLRYFESFFIVLVVYFVLTFTVTRLLRALEKRMDGSSSYTVHGSQSDSRSDIHVTEVAEA